MRIRFYGKLAEQLGSEVDLTPPPGTDTVRKLRQVLAATYPDVSVDLNGRSLVCVGDQIVSDQQALSDDLTIEFLPPLSGG